MSSEYVGSEGLDGVESLIINVGGRLLMLQKDKAYPERRTRKVASQRKLLSFTEEGQSYY